MHTTQERQAIEEGLRYTGITVTPYEDDTQFKARLAEIRAAKHKAKVISKTDKSPKRGGGYSTYRHKVIYASQSYFDARRLGELANMRRHNETALATAVAEFERRKAQIDMEESTLRARLGQ